MVYHKKHTRKFPRQLAIWQVMILMIIMTVVTATLLRMNNVRMIERRDAVIAADKGGDLGMLAERLADLESYVFKHMNATTGQIFLEHTYRNRLNKLIEDARRSLASETEKNAYKAASEVCDKRFRGYSQAYAKCFLDEVNKHTTSISGSTEIKTLNPKIYIRSYASPHWSPDLAGWSVLVWGIMMLYLMSRFITWLVLKIIVAKSLKNG